MTGRDLPDLAYLVENYSDLVQDNCKMYSNEFLAMLDFKYHLAVNKEDYNEALQIQV